jgi:hypothetical protein
MGGAGERNGDGARVLLAAIRLATGTTGLLAPRLLAGRLAESPESRAAAHYPFRLFGIRTVLIGAELLSRDLAVRRRALNVGVLIHASDTVSAYLSGRDGDMPKEAARKLTALSSLNTVLALLARRAARRRG